MIDSDESTGNGKGAKQVVKSKSMVTEEIHLNDFLAGHNIESVETDLGEYIQHTGGGLFAMLPGVRRGQYLGQALLG